MTNVDSWKALFEPCKCENKYTIEKHGDGYVLYYGRCNHRHGHNLVYLKEPALNCDLTHIENLINLGNAEYNKNINEKDIPK
jgi:hypothetical protein